jgi:hypothetical protein
MKEIKHFVIGVGLLLALSVPALAQTGDAAKPAQTPGAQAGKAKGQGRRAGGVASMPVSAIDSVVSLKDDQKTKITDIQTKLKTDVQAATGDATKIRELNRTATTDIQAVLTDEQKDKLKKSTPMLNLLQSSRAIPLAALADVKLTDDQKSKIDAAVTETQDKLKTAPRGDRAARQTINADFKTKVEALLTDDQKKAIAKHATRGRRNANP